MEDIKTILAEAKIFVNANDGDAAEKLLIYEFDDNCYGEGFLVFGKTKITIESIWTDDDNHLNIHVNDKWFEGDVLFRSLSKANQKRVIQTVEYHVKWLIENGIAV